MNAQNNEEFKLLAILCAAGLSTRMGATNKLLLPYQNKPMISYVTDQLCRSQVTDVVVVLGHQSDHVLKALGHMNVKVKIVVNEDYVSGHTSSIRCGLAASSGVDAFMICLGDMPKLQSGHYDEIIDFYKRVCSKGYLITRPMVGDPTSQSYPGHPVVMDRSLIQPMMDCMEEDGCRSVIQSHADGLMPFKTIDDAYVTDVDTVTAYEDITSSV